MKRLDELAQMLRAIQEGTESEEGFRHTCETERAGWRVLARLLLDMSGLSVQDALGRVGLWRDICEDHALGHEVES